MSKKTTESTVVQHVNPEKKDDQLINPDIANVITWVLVFVGAWLAHKANAHLAKKRDIMEKSYQILKEIHNTSIEYWLRNEEHEDCNRLSLKLRTSLDELEETLTGTEFVQHISKLREILTDREFEVPTRLALDRNDRLFSESKHEMEKIRDKIRNMKI